MLLNLFLMLCSYQIFVVVSGFLIKHPFIRGTKFNAVGKYYMIGFISIHEGKLLVSLFCRTVVL